MDDYHAMLSELRLLGAGLPVGSTRSGLVCPKCRGGRTREGSLSLTRMGEDRLAYCCHRSQCSAHGFIGRAFSNSDSEKYSLRGGESTGSGVSEGPNTRYFTGEVRALDGAWLSELQQWYSFTLEDCAYFGFSEDSYSGRLVVHIRSPSGASRGFQLRASRNWSNIRRKTIDYRENDEPWVGWFYPPENFRIGGQTYAILVEDVLSAAKVALAGFIGVSLMGSYLSLDALEEIKETVGENYILALDRDATSRALELSARYSLIAGLIQVMLLDQDLKYETIDTIRRMVKDVVIADSRN